MNNYVRKIASEYNIPINKITIKNNTRIIDDKIVLKKKKNNDLNNVYKYLKSRSFDYFPEPITIDNLYEVYPFLEDTYEPSEQKATDIMHLLGLLHSKTTFYREIDIDKNKEIYENISDELEYLNNFYVKRIERKIKLIDEQIESNLQNLKTATINQHTDDIKAFNDINFKLCEFKEDLLRKKLNFI